MAYGFEAYRADGSTLISSTDGVARLVHAQNVAAQFSGTFSVPAYNSNQGFYAVMPYNFRWYRYVGTYYSVNETDSWDSKNADLDVECVGWRDPTLVWNDDTKIMTVTANALSQSGTGGSVLNKNPRYLIKFIHYR